MRILLVENEPRLAEAVRRGFSKQGFDVAVERTGEEAFFRINTEAFDLVLLDLSLPGRNGIDLLGAIRAASADILVIVFGNSTGAQNPILGLDAGADDYLVKPFAIDELLARTRALCRRRALSHGSRMNAGEVSIDCVTREVVHGNSRTHLTGKEFQLLEYLMRYKGQIVSREALVRDVWKERVRSKRFDNIIDVLIRRLRQKVNADQPRQLIQTVRGVGYILSDRAKATTRAVRELRKGELDRKGRSDD